MGKTWIGLGATVIVEFTLALFAGLETFKGLVLDDPSEWLTSYAEWPWWVAMAFFAAGMFILGTMHFVALCHRGLDRLAQNRRRAAELRRDTLVRAAEEIIDLYRVDGMDPMERLSLLELSESELRKFDLTALDGMTDEHAAMYYRRLLPYLRLGISQAQRAARDWKDRHEG